MKFAKRYINDIKEKQPGWRDKFLSYKELKRLIRLIGDDVQELEQNIKRAIEWRTNQSQSSEETDYKEMRNMLIKDIVDLHGEMVLLINYCNINYTGLARILKKYDRKTGALRHLPFLKKITEHPFLSTDLISKLVKECENMIDVVSQANETVERENDEVVLDGKELFKNTVEALFTIPENVMVFEKCKASEPN
ncbi:SPX domain-containing protein [Trifolium repens]|nr:SPX domain-containing protein [Trifolium repens]